MRRLHIHLIVILILTTLLSACWDERLLNEHSLILTIGLDVTDDERILETVTFPNNSGGSTGGQPITPEKPSIYLSMAGNTVLDAERRMDKRVTEKFDRSKTKVVFIGEELASDGIFPSLDSLYRDLRGPLNANIAVFKGQAKDALTIREEQALLTSDIYANLLKSAGRSGITKVKNLQTTCPILLSDGKDLVLPYISFNDKVNEASIEGIALFHDDKMTGDLNIKETGMFLILSDQTPDDLALNLKVTDDKEQAVKNFVNLEIRKDKRKLQLDVSDGKVRAKIKLSLDVEIDEYAADNLNDNDSVNALAEKIAEQFEELAEVTLAKMQEANNDALGLGEKLKAYHNKTWENIDWDKEYPDVPIETSFDVHIIRHGIIN